jgi:hypothetical protein
MLGARIIHPGRAVLKLSSRRNRCASSIRLACALLLVAVFFVPAVWAKAPKDSDPEGNTDSERSAVSRTSPATQASVVSQTSAVEEPAEPSQETAEYDRTSGNPSDVRLSDQSELEQIIELYMAGQYAACSEQLAAFLNPKGPSPFKEDRVIEQGRLYYASCTLMQGRRDVARKALRSALVENPLMHSPDSLTFPPPVVSLFLEVRDEVQQLITESEREQVVQLRRENELARRRAEQREYREKELEKLARKESVIAKNSRYIAAIPFGVGQFQNGNNVLGGVLLASESLFLVTAVSSGLILADLKSKVAVGIEVETYNRQTKLAYDTLTWSSWALLGTAVLGIVEAELSFKPERKLEDRNRPLPPELEVEREPPRPEENDLDLAPSVGFAPGGVAIGLSGTF